MRSSIPGAFLYDALLDDYPPLEAAGRG